VLLGSALIKGAHKRVGEIDLCSPINPSISFPHLMSFSISRFFSTTWKQTDSPTESTLMPSIAIEFEWTLSVFVVWIKLQKLQANCILVKVHSEFWGKHLSVSQSHTLEVYKGKFNPQHVKNQFEIYLCSAFHCKNCPLWSFQFLCLIVFGDPSRQ